MGKYRRLTTKSTFDYTKHPPTSGYLYICLTQTVDWMNGYFSMSSHKSNVSLVEIISYFDIARNAHFYLPEVDHYAIPLSNSVVAFSALVTFHCLLVLTFSYFCRNGGTCCPAFLAITTRAGEHSLS